jgi:hypothetical protein
MRGSLLLDKKDIRYINTISACNHLSAAVNLRSYPVAFRLLAAQVNGGQLTANER